MRRIWWIALVFPLHIHAQELLPEDVAKRVLEHHPVALTAQLQDEWIAAQEMQARGGFDPKLAADFRGKEYEDKLYYSIGNAGLKVPTPVGVDVLLDYQGTGGEFLNPEATLPIDGLLGAGVSIELGQGLLIDARRAALRQAEYAETLGKAKQQALINALIADALTAYWAWFEAWHQQRILDESVDLAETRRLGVVASAELGEIPFQDTLEAGIQVLNRRQMQLESAQFLQLKQAELEGFLWEEGVEGVQLQPGVRPPGIQNASNGIGTLPPPTGTWLEMHPTIAGSQALIGQKEVELQWKREQLKPELGLKYQWLTSPQNLAGESPVTVRDAAVGLDFAFPLFLRKERASIDLTEIDLAGKRYELATKQRSLQLKSTALRSGFALMEERQTVQRRAVRDSEALLNGERQLFQAGESSLFLVNQREQYFIQTQLKEVEILKKMAENRIKVLTLEAQFGN